MTPDPGCGASPGAGNEPEQSAPGSAVGQVTRHATRRAERLAAALASWGAACLVLDLRSHSAESLGVVVFALLVLQGMAARRGDWPHWRLWHTLGLVAPCWVALATNRVLLAELQLQPWPFALAGIMGLWLWLVVRRLHLRSPAIAGITLALLLFFGLLGVGKLIFPPFATVAWQRLMWGPVLTFWPLAGAAELSWLSGREA